MTSRCALALLSFLLSSGVHAQSTSAQFLAQEQRQGYIMRTEPRRLDTQQLRSENITDEEVREVQNVVGATPDSVLNISGVTAGCKCEDGAGCTSQVWVVVDRHNKTDGLMLSKIDGHWTIGAVQRWWLRYYELRDKVSALPLGKDRWAKYTAWLSEQRQLLESFPQCAEKPAATGHSVAP
jgi:hypothetical protein